MPRAAVLKTSFNSGELTPRMFSRADTEQFRDGAETITNFLITPHGGVDRTPGTKFVNEVKDSSVAARVIPFQFSTIQTYMLVFNDLFIRFCKDGGIITEAAKTITGATAAEPVVITTSGAHGYSNGDEVVIAAVAGMTELNGKSFIVANVAGTTFELTDRAGADIDGTGYTAYSSGGTASRIYQIASPYAAGDLFSIQYAQSADVMYLFHGSYAVRKLSRTAHTTWTLTEVDWVDGPYIDANITAITLDPDDVTGNVTVTASSALFASTDVGRLISYHDGTSQRYLKITAFTDTTHVDADVKGGTAMAGHAASTNWALGAWSGTTGYPACGTFYEQRLAAANTTTSPQTIWLSVSDDFENMLAGSDPADALIYTIATQKVDAIRWLSPQKALTLGTSGGTFSLSSGVNSDPLTPTNVVVKAESTFGCSTINPKQIGNLLFYVQRDSKVIREYGYDINSDGFVAADISLLAEHILKAGVVEMAYQQFPNNVLWTFTREIDQNVRGWSRQDTLSGADLYESVASIPVSGYDEVWFIVKRTIDGQTRRYVERLSAPSYTDQEDAFFVHSGLTYDSTPVSSVSNLDHLEGETVAVLVDGATHPNKTVTDGAIALDREGSVVHVGLPYTSTLKLLPIEAGSAIGTSQSLVKRIFKVFVRVFESLGMYVGDAESQDLITFRESTDPMDSPPALFTGTKEIQPPTGYDRTGQIVITQTDPLPLNVNGLTMLLDGADS